VQAIAAHTDGLIQLDPGNLYRVVKRLLADGLVAEAGTRRAADADGERRRYYRLTPLGGRVLAAELERLRAVIDAPGTRALARRWTS
jgi:DNA-binding PadR family transcriptional regulator